MVETNREGEKSDREEERGGMKKRGRRRKTALETPEKETTTEREHKNARTEGGDFPGGPGVRILHCRCRGGALPGMGLIPGWGTKILHAAWHSKKKKTTTPKIIIIKFKIKFKNNDRGSKRKINVG